jgi:tetratricopeptide (TPR) repeat protein
VTVLGTAGVGKSRLVAEFIAALEAAGEPFRLARGRCRSYGNVSYSALADAVKSQCGIREDDPPEAVAAKTAAAAEELFGDASLAPGLESLVAAVPGPALAREDLFDAWRRFLEALATGGPLVLALEDIHWADEGLLDFLDHAADWAEGPLLLLAAARPELLELRPTWGGGKRNYAAIYLDPLSPGETGAMVEDLLEAPAPADLLRFVVERSEGNPLFGEEILRVLIERGAIRRVDGEWAAEADLAAVEMPRSVKAVLASRIDALPPEEKAVVQDAAVVGREFWPGAVELLSRRSRAEVLAILHRLRAKELVVRREPATFSGEDEFLFRHALIRDVAYESLPKSFRADKHIAVARWAQEQAAERRDELAEMLATHHSEALRYLRELGESPPADLEREAFRWARAAGDRSLRLWQQREAARWLRAAAELAEAIGLPTPERAAAWEAHALAAEEVEPYPRVAESLERALALYDEAALVADAGRVQARLAWTAYLSGREDDVLPLSERAIERLEPLGDGADLATALHVLGWYLFRRVRYEEAERHLRRAIAMAERVGNDVVRGHATISLAFVYQQTQRGRECVEAFEAALDLARRAGDLSLLLRAQLHICGGLEEVLGDDRRGERLAREGLDLARRTGNVGNVGWMAIMLSDMLFDLGRLEEAGVTARESLEASRAVGERLPVGYALERLAVLHALRLELDEAESLVPEIRQIVRAEPEPWLQGWAVLIDGLLAFGRGDLEAAADRLAEGTLPIVDRMFVYGGASVLLECVRALVRVGRAEEAKPFRDRLAWLAVYSVPARAFLGCAEGLLSRSPGPIRGAVAGLEEIGWELELGRALLDLAAMTSDPEAAARGRGLLERCGAPLFLRDGPPA